MYNYGVFMCKRGTRDLQGKKRKQVVKRRVEKMDVKIAAAPDFIKSSPQDAEIEDGCEIVRVGKNLAIVTGKK